MNYKQEDLCKVLFESIKLKFPEVQYAGVEPSVEDPDDLWIRIIMPKNEDRQLKIKKLAAAVSTELLLDYGYHISIMPAVA